MLVKGATGINLFSQHFAAIRKIKKLYALQFKDCLPPGHLIYRFACYMVHFETVSLFQISNDIHVMLLRGCHPPKYSFHLSKIFENAWHKHNGLLWHQAFTYRWSPYYARLFTTTFIGRVRLSGKVDTMNFKRNIENGCWGTLKLV